MISRAIAWMVLGGSVYSLYKFLKPSSASLHPDVQDRLPVAKALPTIPDVEGNYDIDGVSFDTSGVVVSGDGNKSHAMNPEPSVENNVH